MKRCGAHAVQAALAVFKVLQCNFEKKEEETLFCFAPTNLLQWLKRVGPNRRTASTSSNPSETRSAAAVAAPRESSVCGSFLKSPVFSRQLFKEVFRKCQI
jgi:hypothetical protein